MKTPYHFTLQQIVYKRRPLLVPFMGAAAMMVTQAGLAAEMSHEHHQHMEAQEHATHAGHGPRGTHIHHQHGKGGFMFEYRFMRMEMEGLLDGTDKVNTKDISGAVMGQSGPQAGKDYRMAPTDMTMDMHMLMAMYGFTDRLTAMVMLNYFSNKMDMIMHMYMPSGMPMGDMTGSMETSGMGDTRLSAMYSVNNNWTGTLGVSLPTGSIDEKVDMNMSGAGMMPVSTTGVQAPYAMQLGSGTYDLIPSITYKTEHDGYGWGAQLEYTLRLGENDNKYTLGDKTELTAWFAQKLSSYVHFTGRLDYQSWKGIQGQDPKIDPMMSPSNDPDATGGQRLDALVGFAGVFGNHRLGLEVGKPVYQDLTGPQMNADVIYSVGYQFMM